MLDLFKYISDPYSFRIQSDFLNAKINNYHIFKKNLLKLIISLEIQ